MNCHDIVERLSMNLSRIDDMVYGSGYEEDENQTPPFGPEPHAIIDPEKIVLELIEALKTPGCILSPEDICVLYGSFDYLQHYNLFQAMADFGSWEIVCPWLKDHQDELDLLVRTFLGNSAPEFLDKIISLCDEKTLSIAINTAMSIAMPCLETIVTHFPHLIQEFDASTLCQNPPSPAYLWLEGKKVELIKKEKNMLELQTPKSVASPPAPAFKL